MFYVFLAVFLNSGIANPWSAPLIPMDSCEPKKPPVINKPIESPPQKPSQLKNEEKDSITIGKEIIKDTIDNVLFSKIETNKVNFCPSQYYANHFTGICSRTRVCNGKTISFDQPEATNWGYEGKCAPTAGANLLTMACGVYISPKDIEGFGADYTPGWRPSTLRNALNIATEKIMSENHFSTPKCPAGRWKTEVSENSLDHFQKMKVAPKPFAALLFIGPLDVHWITVVSIHGDHMNDSDCSINYNDHGMNSNVSRTAFMVKTGSVTDKHYFVRFQSQ